jgi:hypothetical protein
LEMNRTMHTGMYQCELSDSFPISLYYFILYVLISLINSADSIIRSKWTLSQQPRVEMGVLSTLSVWSFNNDEEKRNDIDFLV